MGIFETKSTNVDEPINGLPDTIRLGETFVDVKLTSRVS